MNNRLKRLSLLLVGVSCISYVVKEFIINLHPSEHMEGILAFLTIIGTLCFSLLFVFSNQLND